jgi:uncharacterized phiE125 gp8 family phage protein
VILKIDTAPTIEPVSLAEAKMHLRLDAETLVDNLVATQSLPFASYAIAADYITHLGTAVDVFGKQAIVILHAGTCGAGGTVDVKIQESDNGTTWTDVTGGAFAQVTTANDVADFELAYTGPRHYIRTVAKVTAAACSFGTSIVANAATIADEDLLSALITAAREQVEATTRRALLTQTWVMAMDSWPAGDAIRIPFGNLQTIDSFTWKDSEGTETTLTENTDYLVEENGEACGRVVLPYGETWPGGDLYPSNPIEITFTCGWTAAADVPATIRAAVKMILADLWEQRGEPVVGAAVHENPTVARLLASWRIMDAI